MLAEEANEHLDEVAAVLEDKYGLSHDEAQATVTTGIDFIAWMIHTGLADYELLNEVIAYNLLESKCAAEKYIDIMARGCNPPLTKEIRYKQFCDALKNLLKTKREQLCKNFLSSQLLSSQRPPSQEP